MNHQTVEILEYSYEYKIKKLIELTVNTILKQKLKFGGGVVFYQLAKKITYGI